MYDFTIGLFESIVKHGLSWSTAAAVLFLILKQRMMKKKLKRYLPFMFREEEVNQTYVHNQITIMDNQRRIMERLGLESAPTLQQSSPLTQKKKEESSSPHLITLSHVQDAKKYTKLEESKMKAYLKKLSRTKLQAYLLASIINIMLLVGYMLDWQDVQAKVEEYTPLINMVIQAFLTAVYVWVEGKVDVAKAEKGNSDAPNFTDSGAAE